MRPFAILLVLLGTACVFCVSSLDAARSVSLENLTAAKGFVVAKGEGSMTVRDRRSLVQVIVTERTQIMGRRAAFAGIAVDDIVRVEGPRTPNQRVVATRVEVLLTAGNVLVVRRSKTETDDTVTLVIW